MAQLTKHEAIEAMCEGKKVAHDLFFAKEWVASDSSGRIMTDETGEVFSAITFWKDKYLPHWYDGWRIVG